MELEVRAGGWLNFIPQMVPLRGKRWPAVQHALIPPESLAFLLPTGAVEAFRRMRYLGPLRVWPEREYVVSGEVPSDVGARGEKAIAALMGPKGQSRATRDMLRSVVREWLKDFGIGTDATVETFDKGRYGRLVLTDPNIREKVNIADVGFGASQVLPVVVQGLYTPENGLLLLEQPEIHLHPAAQATLADLLIEILENRRRLLVETHSEHVVARIQRRVAEGKIASDEIAIYYCRPSREGTQVINVAMDEQGRLESGKIPEGFFEEGYTESMEYFKVLAGELGPG